MKKLLVTLVVIAFMSGFIAPDIFAQSPLRKLGRGCANLLTGVLELPINVVETEQEDGVVAALTYGAVKGAALAFLRTAVGIYEMGTFLIPLPFNYEPVIEPEFLMSEENF